FQAARTFKPLTKEQLSALVDKTRAAALSGKYEAFKTTTRFDGTAQRPAEMG
ncbi:MAG: Twin-arginine translocation pathway signal, partial [Bryobacterales bacterium]|nr:Twin-arginine translocation pathway signal [Bryobacterales bacterium]